MLTFAAERTGKQPSALDIEDLDALLIGAFLDHLEHERHNSIRTRNARLAAIRSLFRYAALRHPEHAATMFIRKAIQLNGSQSAGQLAQDVQVSAFPYRYDQVAQQAYGLLTKFC